MQLLRGANAETALRALFSDSSDLPALALDPPSLEGENPPRVAALATPSKTLLLDLSKIANFGDLLGAHGPLGAMDAKAHHRALLRAGVRGPARWACVQLTEQLLRRGAPHPTPLAEISEGCDLPPPPDPNQSLVALGEYARHIARVLSVQVPKLHALGLNRVSRVEAGAVAPIAEMEHTGMAIDVPRWRALAAGAKDERDTLTAQIHDHLGPKIDRDLFGGGRLNLDNNAELLTLFRALGLNAPNVKRETLRGLPAPLGPWLLRYREVARLTSTYGESFLGSLGEDGRLHPTFEQIGASTGRMACHNPNLQAVTGETGHRDCFRCAPHRRLVVADYATCELRILAEMSGDPVFREAFLRGDDLHAEVASALFNAPVTRTQNPELRHRAKAINFGIVYGMGAGGLAKRLEITREQALTLLEDYFQKFPKIKDFLEDTVRQSLARGYAETLTGRKLLLSEERRDFDRAATERVARNMPIQGTSADMTKLALANVRTRLRALPGAALVNAVHDELVVECDATHAGEVARHVHDGMMDAGMELLPTIPTSVDVTTGDTWSK